MRRSGLRKTATVLVAAVMALGFVACGDDDDDDDSSSATTTPTTVVRGEPVVTVDMVDHAFQVSGPLVAGGTLRIANKGSEIHMVGLGRFKPGKTLADLQRVLSQQAPPTGDATTTTVQGATTSTARGATTTTAQGATTSTARGATTTTARGATTTTTAQVDPTADILEEVGLPGNVMGPGEAVEVTVPSLAAGTYALICFIPTEGEGTPHFAKGMVSQLEVVAGPAPTPPTPDATYRVAAGRAVEGPATLTAGRHIIKFEAAPGSEQLEPSIARLNAGATLARLNTALETLFEGTTPPAKGAASRLPGQIVFGGFDLLNITELYVAVDLRPGNYVIVANDTDVPTTGTPREMLAVRVT